MGAIIAAVVLLLVLLIGAVSAEIAEWTTWCEAQGGHVLTDTDYHTGIGYGGGGNGGVVVTTTSTTDRYCLSPEGGIIDIQ